MSARDDAIAKEKLRRENDRELKKVHHYYTTLSRDEQDKIDMLAHRSAELEHEDKGKLQVDLELVPIARLYGIKRPVISCALARTRHRRWMQSLREMRGPEIENAWSERVARIAEGSATSRNVKGPSA